MSERPLLRVENLSVRFGGLHAVRDASFSLRAGEVLGLVGESGSGKSMTCRALLGLLPPAARTAGRVVFDGRDLGALRPDEWRGVRGREIAMVFQNPSSHLDPLMTLGGHVAEPLRFHFGRSRRAARRDAVEILRSVRIAEPERRADAYPHELSGGMKQRGLIGSAMACAPKLLLADEPTTALDVTVQARILELLRELNRNEGVAIVLVSHDLAVVAEMCHRVAVMRHGEIVEQGPTAEVLNVPRHAYTRLLLDSQPSASPPPPADTRERPPLVSLENLSVRFERPGWFGKGGAVNALDGVSFTIGEGERFGIVGESGSGKSTVARAITRLVRPSGGRVLFQGRDVAELAGEGLTAFRRAVQMVFQNPFDSLNPRMRVLDAIAEPLLRHRLAAGRAEAAERAAELMGHVELSPELAGRRPGELSGGQCQRVGIARALALGPRLLIADEVTSALDVTIQAQILRLLARLSAERGMTVVLISHDLAVVRRFCDRIAVMRAARLVESGPAAAVLEQPGDSYTRELIRSAPSIERALNPDGAAA